MELRRSFGLKIKEEVVVNEEEDSDCLIHEASPSNVQKVVVVKVEQQERSRSLDQDQEEPEPPHIKEEQEELWSSQEGEQQLQGLEEADITKFTFTPVPVKSEDDGEKPQSSQLHQTHTEHMETEAAGEDCGGPGPHRDPDPDTDDQTGDSSGPDTDNSADWKETRGPKSAPVSKSRCGSGEKLFSCSVCKKSFTRSGNLDIHMRSHTGEKPFSCSECGKIFSIKGNLSRHLRVHTGEKPYSCSVCGHPFAYRRALQKHTRIHTGEKPFSCSECGKKFGHKKHLKRHMTTHIEEKSLCCFICGKKITDVDQTQQTGEKQLSCRDCEKMLACSECGKRFSCMSLLNRHIRIHTGEKPFSCSVCGKSFTQKGQLTRHNLIHTERKPFSCSFCDKLFKWPHQVKRHKCVSGQSQLHQSQTEESGEEESTASSSSEEMESEADEEPESDRNSDPDTHLQPDTDDQLRDFSEPEDNVDIEFWKETRQHQSGFTYWRNKKVSGNEVFNTEKKPSSCSDDEAETPPKSEDSINGDFCSRLHSGPNHLKTEDVSVSETGSNTDKKPPSSSKCHQTSEDSQLNHESPAIGEKPFSCSVCGKGFSTGGYLTRHISVHTGEKPLGCIVCEKQFTLESQLLKHRCAAESLQLHTANKLFTSSMKHQKVPTRVNTKPKQYSSSIIDKTFVMPDISNSFIPCHTGEKPLHCSVCNASVGDNEALVQHMRIHMRQTQFRCSICGQEFAWRRYLTKHMEVHSKKKNYSCSVCDKTFTWLYQFIRHKTVCPQSSQLHQSHTEDNRQSEPPASSSAEYMETEAAGEDCGRPEPDGTSDPDTHLKPDPVDQTGGSSEPETDDSADWKETREPQSGLGSLKKDDSPVSDSRCGADEKPQSCSECGKKFASKTGLKRHMMTHTGERPFSCSECEKRFVLKESLKRHMRTHTGEKPFSCSICKKSFTLSGCLQRHMHVHTGEQPFSCSECGKGFVIKTDLKRHIITHTGEKLFRCSVCGKRFGLKGNLKIHMRTHTGEKPFSCSVCGKSFLQGGNLTEHMSIHMAEKPFSCTLCDRFFNWPHQLRNHKCAGAQSSQLHQSQTDESREEEPAASSAQQIHTEAGKEDLTGPELDGNCNPGAHLGPDTDDSVDSDFWKETR